MENNMGEMVECFQSIIRDEFDKYINKTNVELFYNGIVKSVSTDNKTAKVELSFMTTDFIPNLTGKTLSVGDKVKVYSDRNTMVDSYIGVAF